jgi:putative heme iron utilization protein
MEPVTTASALFALALSAAKPVIVALAAGTVRSSVLSLLNGGREKMLKLLSVPGESRLNDDIARAARRAFKTALQVYAHHLARHHCPEKSSSTGTWRRRAEECKEVAKKVFDWLSLREQNRIESWLLDLQTDLDKADPNNDKDDSWEDLPDALNKIEDEVLFALWKNQPNPAAERRIDEVLSQYAANWLRKSEKHQFLINDSESKAAQWLQNGWENPVPPGATASAEHLTIGKLWAESFRYELKHNHAATIARLFETLAGLHDGQDDIKRELEAISQKLVKHDATLLRKIESLLPTATYFTDLLTSVHDLSTIVKDTHEKTARIEETVSEMCAKNAPTLHPLQETLDAEKRKLQGETNVNIGTLHFKMQWLDYEPDGEAEKRLGAFLSDDAPFKYWALVGPGGAGKSRFALQAILDARDDGWEAGFIEGDWLSQDARGWLPTQNTLLVCDYAAKHSVNYFSLVTTLAEHCKTQGVKVRLLFLERLNRLAAMPAKDGDIVISGARQYLFAEKKKEAENEIGAKMTSPNVLITDEEALTLRLATTPKEVSSRIRKVLQRLGVEPQNEPAVNDEGAWETLRRLTDNGRWLYVSLLGVILKDKEGDYAKISLEKPETLLREMLLREMQPETGRWWQVLANTCGGDAQRANTLMKAFVNGLGIATLCAGLEKSESGEDVLRFAFNRNEDDEEPLFAAAEIILGIDEKIEDEAEKQFYQPVAPDLLGEYLLLYLAKGDNKRTPTLKPIFVEKWIETACANNSDGVALTLLHLLDDFATNEHAKKYGEVFLTKALPESSGLDEASAENQIASGIIAAKLMSGGSPVAETFITGQWGESELTALSFAYFAVRSHIKDGEDKSFEWFVGKSKEWIENPEQSYPCEAVADAFVSFSFETQMSSHTEKESEFWRQIANTILVQNPKNTEIQTALTIGAVNAILRYGEGQKWGELEHWGAILQSCAKENSASPEIQTLLAEGVVNAIICYGKYQKWNELKQWGEILQSCAKENSDNAEIQTVLAKGAFNAINGYGKGQKWGELEHWGAILQTCAKENFDSPEIQTELAKGAFNAITYYGEGQKWKELKQWGEILQSCAKENSDSPEIQMALAKGAANAIICYGKDQKWKELEHWGAVLQFCAKENLDSPEIQTTLVKGAVNAILGYEEYQKWDELEHWGEILTMTLSASPLDLKLFYLLAQFAGSREKDVRIRAVIARAVLAAWPGFGFPPNSENQIVSLGELLATDVSLPEDVRKAARAARELAENESAKFRQQLQQQEFSSKNAMLSWWKAHERLLPPLEFVMQSASEEADDENADGSSSE